MLRFCSFFVVSLSLFSLGNASTAVFTTDFPDCDVGTSLNLSWKGAFPPSNISLDRGTYLLPDFGVVINIPGTDGYYVWKVPLDLPTDMYGFYIEDSSMFNGVSSYSNYFNITQTNSSVGAFVKPTPAVFADSATATSYNVTVTSSAAANSSSGGSRGGLSDGAKAGIGVGVACAVLVVVGLAAFWRRGKRRSGTQMPPVAGSTINEPYGKAELPGSGKMTLGANADSQKAELAVGEITTDGTVELDSDRTTRAELA
ncbi:hypothetical protein BGW36DRAFT_53801 [Talaromyces proteolyticus]|uniref:Yeast cell wall synthesis Kre9/Knh1-like N-terminal domain-containing protein n=1 Tax=Talaromyces proteolyticus TaxID=1131652 RepID=A0AAD4PTX5_9EURO|nr:uncharacterized protein BGW36DRAFT_53801 [Talaromyces proteolyticus]KAH8691505.1 hypothetical protein BGW36DRAFT_53801 [Talaromyces proteolyticus]